MQLRARQFFSVEAFSWVIFLIALSVAIFGRLRLLDIPLERDEGEYAYSAQLLLQGIPPYKLCYTIKLPGTASLYALSMALFGQTIKGIHLGFLLVNLASIALIFFITRQLFGSLAGRAAAATYSLLSVSPSVLGLQAHAEHCVVFMCLCGLVLLRKHIFWSGLFFGLAFLMKQPGIFFILFGAVQVVIARSVATKQSRFSEIACLPARQASGTACPRNDSVYINLAVYILGAALPFAVTCLALYLAGVFDKFWFWTVQYALEYSSGASVYLALKIFKAQLLRVIQPFELIWYISAAGFLCAFFDPRARKNFVFIAVLLVTSLLAIWPGFIFREHYFVLALPIVSILAGVCVNSATGFLGQRSPRGVLRFAPVVIFAALLLSYIYQQKHYFFKAAPLEVSRESYGVNPFVESVKIGDYLKANSSVDDTIAVLGSEPQVYFYANRHSATGYIYAYPLMENQPYALNMQQEMIKEIESQNPRYLVFVNVATSWLRRADSQDFIFKWLQKYIAERYEIDQVVSLEHPYSALLYKQKLSTG